MSRRLAIIDPLNLEILGGTTVNNGVRSFETSDTVDYQLALAKTGREINPEDYSLDISNLSGRMAGEHFLRTNVQDGGLTLDSVRKPFSYLYRYDSDQLDRYLGQSNINAKEYRRFRISNNRVVSDKCFLRNLRLFEYDAKLYALGESVERDGENNLAFVELYVYDDEYEIFRLVKRFEDYPVDTTVDMSNFQYGSPDYFIYEGELFIVYKYVKRDVEKSFIAVFKTDKAAFSFVEESNFEILNQTYYLYDDFRLRAAQGDGVVMLVMYGLKAYTIDSTPDYTAQLKDMRQYVSFDGGKVFSSKNDFDTGIVVNDGGEFVTPQGSTSLYAMFVPFNRSGEYDRNMNNFNNKFDLFFDQNTASFMLFKCGDSNSDDADEAATYLMGVKTSPEDFFIWEPVVKYKLDVRAHGINPDQFDPFNEQIVSSSEKGSTLKILDLDVVEMENSNYILFSLEKQEFNITSDAFTRCTAIAEFNFISADYFPKGYYDKILAYGCKSHEEYAFMVTPINPDNSGIISSGTFTEYDNAGDVALARWRDQLISTCLMDDLSYYPFLAVHGAWSNLGDVFGYEQSYSRFLLQPQRANFEKSFSSGLNEAPLTSQSLMRCYIQMNGQVAYYSSSGNLFGPVGAASTISRAGLGGFQNAKAKFGCAISGVPALNTVTFFRMIVSDQTTDSKFKSIELRANNLGNVFAYNISGHYYGQVNASPLTLSNYNEFYVSIGKTDMGDDLITIWFRANGELYWTHMQTYLLNPETPSGLKTSSVLLGIISYTSFSATMYVDVGDIFVGSYEAGYRSFNGDKQNQVNARIDSTFNKYYLSSDIDSPFTANYAKTFSNFVTLHDGTILRFKGGKCSRRDNVEWSLRRIISSNDSSNIFSGVADHAYDFTGASSVEMILNNKQNGRFDAISFVNVAGITDIELVVGEYDVQNSVWITSQSTYYQWPKYELNLQSVSGKYIIYNNDLSFQKNQLAGYYIFIKNELTNDWESMVRVIENFDNIIKTDEVLPTSDRSFHLSYQAASFSVPEAFSSGNHGHIGLNITCVPLSKLSCIGEFCAGELVDLDNLVTAINYSTSDQKQEERSQRNYGFNSKTDQGSPIVKLSIDLDLLTRDNEESALVASLLQSLYLREINFPVLEQTSQGNITSYGVIESFSLTPEFPADNASVEIVLQNWRQRRNIPRRTAPPSLEIYLDSNDVGELQNIEFKAVAVDPDGGVVTYLWDFGDTTSSTLQNPTKAYSAVGRYIVTCTATDADGDSTSKTVTVYVNPAKIDDYELAITGTSPYAQLTNISCTLRAVDSSSNAVTYDSTTQFVAVSRSPDLQLDMNGDLVYDAPGVDINTPYRLLRGEHTFNIYATDAGTFQLTIVDVRGIVKTFDITFA